MSYLFISHIEEDRSLAEEMASCLEHEGYKVWYYERDSLPGPSYLVQTAKAIEQSLAVIVIISPQSLNSNQVTKEVVRAHEAGKPFIPILQNLSHAEFQRLQPEWREAIGSSASVRIPPEGVRPILPKILSGILALALQARERQPATNPVSGVLQRNRTDAKRIVSMFPDVRQHKEYSTSMRTALKPKKVCLLGAPAVGKTSLVRQFVESIYSDVYQTTVGVKIDRKTVRVGEREVTLVIWDLYGEDESAEVGMSYLQGSSGCLLVADGTRLSTLERAYLLHQRINSGFPNNELSVVLLINKSDLAALWAIDDGSIESLEEKGWTVLKTSAKTGIGVEEGFIRLASNMCGIG